MGSTGGRQRRESAVGIAPLFAASLLNDDAELKEAFPTVKPAKYRVEEPELPVIAEWAAPLLLACRYLKY